MKYIKILIACLLLSTYLPAQNIGINQPNPKYRLDVYGQMNLDSGIYYLHGAPMIDINAVYLFGQPVLKVTPSDNLYLGFAININGGGTLNTFIGAGAGTITGNAGSGNVAVGRVASTENGNNSVAIGALTEARHNNAIAIGANAIAPADNTIRLGDNNITGLYANVGLTVTSDSTKKENFLSVNGENILQKISSLHLATWNLKGQDARHFRHYGPTAQEFYQAFGKDDLGSIGNDTTINSQDFNGINIIAIQALEKRTAQITELQQENVSLKNQLSRLQTEMIALQKQLADAGENLKIVLARMEQSSNNITAKEKEAPGKDKASQVIMIQ